MNRWQRRRCVIIKNQRITCVAISPVNSLDAIECQRSLTTSLHKSSPVSNHSGSISGWFHLVSGGTVLLWELYLYFPLRRTGPRLGMCDASLDYHRFDHNVECPPESRNQPYKRGRPWKKNRIVSVIFNKFIAFKLLPLPVYAPLLHSDQPASRWVRPSAGRLIGHFRGVPQLVS